MHEIRDVESPYRGFVSNIYARPGRLSIRAVFVQDELAPVVLAPLFGVPDPMIVIPIFDGTTTPFVQVHDPAGI
jgi:hypothetical protein